MTAVALFAMGNALVDQVFVVDDQFFSDAGLRKGTMQLCDAEQQQQLIANLAHAKHSGQASGGSAANTVVAFSALGGSSFYACRVGDDALAEFYLEDLQQIGVQTAALSLTQGTTGTCVVMVSADAERTMCTYLGVSAELGAAQVDYQVLAASQWLYIEGYLATCSTAREAVLKARQVAREHGVKIAISFSDPAMVKFAKDGLLCLLGDGVDILFCNEQEALMFNMADSVEQAGEQLLQLAELVVITLGSRGALLLQRGQAAQIIETPQVKAVDSNGAGDAFAGAFLYALSEKHSPEQATRLANHIASKLVTQFGPRLTQAQYQEIAENI